MPNTRRAPDTHPLHTTPATQASHPHTQASHTRSCTRPTPPTSPTPPHHPHHPHQPHYHHSASHTRAHHTAPRHTAYSAHRDTAKGSATSYGVQSGLHFAPCHCLPYIIIVAAFRAAAREPPRRPPMTPHTSPHRAAPHRSTPHHTTLHRITSHHTAQHRDALARSTSSSFCLLLCTSSAPPLQLRRLPHRLPHRLPRARSLTGAHARRSVHRPG